MTRNVLILDTSSDAVCVGIGSSVIDAANMVKDEKSRHGENLSAAIGEAFKQQEIELENLGAVGVGIGPGSFTGLRIGIIAAHTFAHALNIPIVYFSSLELVALSSLHDDARNKEVVVQRDARRKELYRAVFIDDEQGIREAVVDGVTVASVLKRLETEHLVPYPDAGPWPNIIKPSSAIELVQKAVDQNIVADMFAAQAIYIRKSDAELSWNIKS